MASFRDYIRALPRRHSNDNRPQKIVAVIDSIASVPGVLLPWQDMVKICQEEGVWSVIDGAQSMGQEVGLDVGASGCDFWTSVNTLYFVKAAIHGADVISRVQNSHKWLIGKRSSAVLYVPKRSVIILSDRRQCGVTVLARDSYSISMPIGTSM